MVARDAVESVTLRIVEERSAEVTALVLEWIEGRRADGWSFQRIADAIGVTKTQVINVHGGSRGVGASMEERFARLAYGGSLDALRKAAHEAATVRARASVTTLPPAIRAAVDMTRAVRAVPDSVVARLAKSAALLGDLSTTTWVAILNDALRDPPA